MDDLIMSGFKQLDEHQTFNPGSLITIGGRPAVGKTSLALSIALKYCESNNMPVLIYSYELLSAEITSRLISGASEVDFYNLKNKDFDKDDLKKIGQGIKNISSYPIYINDSSDFKIKDIEKQIVLMGKKQKPRLLIIDYIQLVDGIYKDARLRKLKILAQEYNLSVLVLSQLKKQAFSKGNANINDLLLQEEQIEFIDKCIIIKSDEKSKKRSVYLLKKEDSFSPTQLKMNWEPKYLQFNESLL